jgi:hypothetical protein
MSNFGFILLFFLIAGAAACIVTFIVGLLRSDRADDMPSVWWDILLRIFAVRELGLLGRVLNWMDGSWARRILSVVGIVALILTLFHACRDTADVDPLEESSYRQSFPFASLSSS